VQKLDFKSNPTGTISTINSWISRLTKGYLRDLVSSSSITPSTSILLANALFYSGQWEKPFTVLPGKKSFKIDPKIEIKLKMMVTEGTFGYSFIPELGSTGITLPFKDDRFEFIILKPEEGQSVESVRPLLINYPLEQLAHKLNENLRTVTLTLPKFTLKSNYDTVKILKKVTCRVLNIISLLIDFEFALVTLNSPKTSIRQNISDVLLLFGLVDFNTE